MTNSQIQRLKVAHQALSQAHDWETNEDHKKVLRQGMNALKQHQDEMDRNAGNEGNAGGTANEGGVGDNGGNNSVDQSAANLSEKPTVDLSNSLRFNKMPMKDLEKHVKGMANKKQSNSDGPKGMGW